MTEGAFWFYGIYKDKIINILDSIVHLLAAYNFLRDVGTSLTIPIIGQD